MRRNFLLIVLLQFIVSCAPLSHVQDKNELLAYLSEDEAQTLLSRFLPVFIIEQQNNPYNRIGTAKAELTGGGERIYVDPRKATIYTEERKLKTSNNTYTNLIYRIHFSETPFGLFPFQIGAGKNVGLLVIVTLNKSNQPVLYSIVHTCGCYLAFIPTSYLPPSAYPSDWPEKQQIVYAEILPAILDLKTNQAEQMPLMVLLRSKSHRVKDVWLSDQSALKDFSINFAVQKPLAELEHLPLSGNIQTTSFYETTGKRTGYVKGSYKPLERLLVSWWAFEWNIGEDKKLSADKNELPNFFTSLKPWARDASDMRDFPAFLTYWGWNL